MMLERHGGRERTKARGAGENLAAVRRMRLDQLALAPVQRPGLLHHFERHARLADVMEERRFHQGDDHLSVEPDLPADQKAQHRHVDRMAPRQVLVVFHRQHVAERRIAAGDAPDEELDRVPHGAGIEVAA